jgi:hypothetical protein
MTGVTDASAAEPGMTSQSANQLGATIARQLALADRRNN